MNKKAISSVLGLITLVIVTLLLRKMLAAAPTSPLPIWVAGLGATFILALTSTLMLKWLPILRSFWGAAFLSLLAATVLVASDLVPHVPFFGPLWIKRDNSGLIALVILFVVLWCLIVLAVRFFTTRSEFQAIRETRKKLLKTYEPVSRKELQEHLNRSESNEGRKSLILNRLHLLVDNFTQPERATRLLSEQGGLDTAQVQTAYGPLRALVWALPALGFIGTAAAMAASIKGVGASLTMNESYADNQTHLFLISRVIPSLADAFSITLVALASTIFCFFLLSVVYGREEKMLSDIDELILQVTGKIDSPPSFGAQGGGLPDQLLPELWSLEQEVSKLGGQIQHILEGRGYAETLSTCLAAIVTELRLVNMANLRALNGEKDNTDGAHKVIPADGLLRELIDELKQLNQNMNSVNGREPAVTGMDHRKV